LNNLNSFRTAIETLQYPLRFQKNLDTYIFWGNILRLSIATIVLSSRKTVADGDFLDVISKWGDERCQGIALIHYRVAGRRSVARERGWDTSPISERRRETEWKEEDYPNESPTLEESRGTFNLDWWYRRGEKGRNKTSRHRPRKWRHHGLARGELFLV